MRVPALPDHYKTILKIIQRRYPSAIIGGGALRDLVWGGAVKDIDVFINIADGTLADRLPDLERDLQAQKTEISRMNYYGKADEVGKSALLHVSPLGSFGDIPPINVVEITLPKSEPYFEAFVRKRMDFGACQLTYDGNLVRMSSAAEKDLAENTLTLMRAESEEGVQRSLRRAERLIGRYPGLRLKTTYELQNDTTIRETQSPLHSLMGT